MSSRPAFLPLLVALVGILALLWLFQRQLSRTWLAFGSHPEVLEQLERAREDQRDLARLDPEHQELYRQRFEETQTLLQRLHVLEHTRELIRHRFELVLLGLLGSILLLAALFHRWHQRRLDRRLERLRGALEELSAGRTDLSLGERRRDTVGRIAAMIEQTSRVMARDRRRLAALANLSAWQEAARRHAHEMRTPLTGAGLELTRLDGLLEGEALRRGGEIRQAAQSARQELERLKRFTQEFTSFGRLPRPRRRRQDLVELLRELVQTFAGAWPNLRLELVEGPGQGAVEAAVDRDLLRQVLVNLCDNSSLAIAARRESQSERVGTVRLSARKAGEHALLEVADDGPGIAPAVRERLFEPYTTTRGIGEGMGLGLAICRKILLDHEGDLELLETGTGATFRLTLPSELPREEGIEEAP